MTWTDHKWAFIILLVLGTVILADNTERYMNATGRSNRRRKFDNPRTSMGRIRHPLLGMGSE